MGGEANTRTNSEMSKGTEGKGKEIKIERGKVKIQDKWKYWEDLEKEIEREKETGRVTTQDRQEGSKGGIRIMLGKEK